MNKGITFELNEAASLCQLRSEDVLQFIQYQWLRPCDPIQLVLDQADISRIQFILDLKKDFDVNDQSIPIILHLVDQLNYLHFKLSKA